MGNWTRAQFLFIWVLATAAPFSLGWLIFIGDTPGYIGWTSFVPILMTGIILGLTQWLVLKRTLNMGTRWVVASGLASLAFSTSILVLAHLVLEVADRGEYLFAPNFPIARIDPAVFFYYIYFIGATLLGIAQSLMLPRQIMRRSIWVVAYALGVSIAGLGSRIAGLTAYLPWVNYFPRQSYERSALLSTTLLAGLGIGLATGIAFLIANERAKRAVR